MAYLATTGTLTAPAIITAVATAAAAHTARPICILPVIIAGTPRPPPHPVRDSLTPPARATRHNKCDAEFAMLLIAGPGCGLSSRKPC